MKAIHSRMKLLIVSSLIRILQVIPKQRDCKHIVSRQFKIMANNLTKKEIKLKTIEGQNMPEVLAVTVLLLAAHCM